MHFFCENKEELGFSISCETCGATLVPDSNNHYDVCAMCGKMPSNTHIIRQLYLHSGKKDPILLFWNPTPDEIVFKHPHSGKIPEDSLIIVNPDQTAFYYANGNLIQIHAGEIYAPRTGSVDIADIARGLQKNSGATLSNHLNTRLIFVDHRTHYVEPLLTVTAAKGEWDAEIQVEMTLQIASNEQARRLLAHAFNFDDGTSVSNQLLKHIQTHVLDELDSAIYELNTEHVLDTEDETSMRQSLRIHLNRQNTGLRNAVNSRLEQQLGITLTDVYFRPVQCKRRIETTAVRCPFPGCTQTHHIPKGQIRYECMTLSRKTLHPVTKKPILYFIRWCENCNAYTSDYERDLICDVCHLRYRP